MELQLVRRPSSKECTIGQLCIGDQPILYTLEDVVREVKNQPVDKWKIKGETAIPAGKYKVEMNWSNKYGKLMPFLQGVPGFVGIMIHPGNSKDDTEGCILVGEQLGENQILQSRSGFNVLLGLIESAVRRNDPINITVK